MSIKKVKMLGYFTVYNRNNRVINITSHKAIALFIYLIHHPNTSLTRDKLAGLLWDDCDRLRAKGNLRQLISRLRQQLPDHCLEISHYSLVLKAESLDIDENEFQQLSHSNDILALEQAIQLYQGELAQDFSDISIDFDSWLNVKRLELHEKMRLIANKILQYYLSQHLEQKALSLAQFILSFDPFNEEIHYLIMTIYLRQGRRTDAIVQYQSCQRLLYCELNIVPNTKLTKLYHGIKPALCGEKYAN